MNQDILTMNIHKNKIAITVIFFACVVASTPTVAQPAGNFVRLVNSPRGSAMGSSALLLLDQESVFYNPSAMALYHLKKQFSITPPIGTAWFPDLADDILLRGVSFTYSLIPNKNIAAALSVGVFYQRFTFGTIILTDATGAAIRTLSPSENTYGLSLGYARMGRIKYGFGITARLIESHLGAIGAGAEFGIGTARASLIDAAVMLEVPVAGSADEDNEFSVRASILQTLYGADFVFIDQAQPDPTPKVNQFGAAVSASWGDPKLRSLSLLASAQLDTDVSGALRELESVRRGGIEVGLFESFYVRAGAFSSSVDIPFPSSFGSGFSFNGFLRLVSRDRLGDMNDDELPFWRRIDIRFDYAKIRQLPDDLLSNTKFWKISLALLR